MTDRELLEKAAKAAGIVGIYVPASDGILEAIAHNDEDDCQWYWNPLVSDEDALRLAVKLRLDVHFEMNGVGGDTPIVEVMDFEAFRDGGTFCADEDCTADPYAATRRAIVRAAAALGEAQS